MSPFGTSPLWLFSKAVDLSLFLGVAAVSVAVAVLFERLHVSEHSLALWVATVLLIDVAHVWSTTFRVYFDAPEVARRPVLYWGAPLSVWAVGALLHSVSAGTFWRALAYLAVWHFVRQQVGFMALYGRQAVDPANVARFDAAAVYAATLGPVVWWHANLPRAFWWFVEGDFAPGVPSWVGSAGLVASGLIVSAWFSFALTRPRIPWGKAALVAATVAAWWVGIVWAPTDVSFTVTNVALHGIPYFYLVHRATTARVESGQGGRFVTRLMALGPLAFLVILWSLAFMEEWAWDTLVWHDHSALFGTWGVHLAPDVAALVVPLLALPQGTHYVLDGFIWKRQASA